MGCLGSDAELARLRSQAHRASFADDVLLLVEQSDDGVFRIRVELGRVGVRQTENISGEFYDGDLHAQAEAEIRQFLFAGVLRGHDFPFNAAFAETAWNQDAAQAL